MSAGGSATSPTRSGSSPGSDAHGTIASTTPSSGFARSTARSAQRPPCARCSPTYAATPMRWPAISRHSARKPAPTCRLRKSLPTGEARTCSLPVGSTATARDPRPHRPSCVPPDRAAPRRPAGRPWDGPPRHRPGHGQAPRSDSRTRHSLPRRARLRWDSLTLPTGRPALLRPVRGPRPTRSHRPADPVDRPPSPGPRTRCRRVGPPVAASTYDRPHGEASAVVSHGRAVSDRRDAAAPLAAGCNGGEPKG
jgi:hypothetical protein